MKLPRFLVLSLALVLVGPGLTAPANAQSLRWKPKNVQKTDLSGAKKALASLNPAGKRAYKELKAAYRSDERLVAQVGKAQSDLVVAQGRMQQNPTPANQALIEAAKGNLKNWQDARVNSFNTLESAKEAARYIYEGKLTELRNLRQARRDGQAAAKARVQKDLKENGGMFTLPMAIRREERRRAQALARLARPKFSPAAQAQPAPVVPVRHAAPAQIPGLANAAANQAPANVGIYGPNPVLQNFNQVPAAGAAQAAAGPAG